MKISAHTILRAGIWAIVLLTPLLFFPGIIHLYTAPKAVFFFVVVDILAITALLSGTSLEQKYLDSPLTKLLILELLLMMVSAVFGESLLRSVLGTSTRMTGILMSAHLLLFFLLCGMLRKEQWIPILRASVWLSLGIAAFSFLQYLFPGQVLDLVGDRQITAFFGNKAYVAYYFLMHFFLGLFLYRKQRDRKALGISCCLLLMLLMLGTKGVYLSLLITALISGFIFFRNARGRVIILLLILISVIATLSFRGLFWENHSVQSRLLLWKISLQALVERPLLGWGPENFEMAYNTHYDPKMLRFNPADNWVDRAHNDFVQGAVEMGLLGAIWFLAFWGYILFRSRKDSLLFSLFLSFFVLSLVEVESISGLILLMALLAFLARSDTADQETPRHLKGLSLGMRGAMIVLFSVHILYQSVFFLASIRMESVIRNELVNLRASEFLKAFEKGFALARFHPLLQAEESLNAVTVFLRVTFHRKVTDVPVVLLQTFERFLKETSSLLASTDLQHQYVLAGFLKTWSWGDETRQEEAEKVVKKALEVNKKRQMFLFSLGELQLLNRSGAADLKGLWTLNEAMLLEPNAAYAHWILGKTYWQYKLPDGAVREIEKAMEIGYLVEDPEEIEQLLPFFSNMKRYQTVNAFLLQLVKLQPRKPLHYTRLATSYLMIGDKENALKAAEKAFELDPSLRESEGAQEIMDEVRK